MGSLAKRERVTGMSCRLTDLLGTWLGLGLAHLAPSGALIQDY